jgi:hypothetical protein
MQIKIIKKYQLRLVRRTTIKKTKSIGDCREKSLMHILVDMLIQPL